MSQKATEFLVPIKLKSRKSKRTKRSKDNSSRHDGLSSRCTVVGQAHRLPGQAQRLPNICQSACYPPNRCNLVTLLNVFMTDKVLAGKIGLVFGVANKRCIAWAIAQAWDEAGARLIFTYQGERLKENVEELAGAFGEKTPLFPCDVTRDDEITAFFENVRSQTIASI